MSYCEKYLDLPMGENDAEAETIRQYFGYLLESLWIQEESFSGKKPFGNSGWQNELYPPLVKAGAIRGEIDKYGYADNVDIDAADEIILEMIREMFRL